ncbi:MAG: RNA methyltransferase [Defluviitaleaceae bacterium]|nr:RNA methyltransferase [Defluviitaleaceae bacterium]
MKGLLKEKTHFIAEGKTFVDDIPKFINIFGIFIDEAKKDNFDIEHYKSKSKVYIISAANFKKLSNTVTPQGILALCEIPIYEFPKLGDLYLFLDGIRDPGNMGTIIRTAESAGVSAIFLSKNCVNIYNPKVLRSTMGAIFNLPIFSCDIVSELRKLKDFKIICTSPNTEKIYYEESLKENIAIVVGNEAAGVSEEVFKEANAIVSIPMAGKSESLNAGVASGIMIYEVLRQRAIGGTLYNKMPNSKKTKKN